MEYRHLDLKEDVKEEMRTWLISDKEQVWLRVLGQSIVV